MAAVAVPLASTFCAFILRRPRARLPNREPGDHLARAGRTAREGTGRVPGQGAVGTVAEGANVLMSTLNVLIQRLDEHI